VLGTSSLQEYSPENVLFREIRKSDNKKICNLKE